MRKQKSYIISIAVLILAILFVSGCSTNSHDDAPFEGKSVKPELNNLASSDYNSALVRNYEIVEIEDISIKAMDKPLSAYSTSEISNLPTNVRKRYRIIVPSDISKEEFKSTLIQLVLDESKKNPDIDEIVAFVYDRKEDANDVYTFGKLEWCPNGDWASVTPQIASTNDRSAYKYVFDIKDKVGNIDNLDKPTERELGIFDYYDNLLLDETERFYDAQDAGLSYKYSDETELEEKIGQEVANKYDITKKELDDIYIKVMVYKMK